MADEPKALTQADIDKAVKAALEEAKTEFAEDLEKEKGKNAGLLEDLKKAQREARAAKEVTPEQLQAEIDRADKAEAERDEIKKQVGTLTKERDKAVKDLETESAAARNAWRLADINAAVASGGIAEGLVDGYTAMLERGAVTEVVDGKYVTLVGGKPVGEHSKEFLASDAGKAYRAAMINTGGGAGGGGGSGSGKSMPQSQFDALPAKEKAAKMAEGYALTDG